MAQTPWVGDRVGNVTHCSVGIGRAPVGMERWHQDVPRATRAPSRPIVDLIGAMETQSEPSELELDDVVITNPHIEAILENEDWIEDCHRCPVPMVGVPMVGVPNVSVVPKSPRLVSPRLVPPLPPPSPQICHTLTEKLVAMTMGSGARVKSPSSLGDIIVVAKRISPRVDDVVRSMYPPLDPKLLDRVGHADFRGGDPKPGPAGGLSWEPLNPDTMGGFL
uniref:Transmembrane protein 98 n=1 Tax=Pavo cristatus TaxID=9049 RepID=A0A8C9G2U4_PAVCR